jgi:hypothetical protein
MIYLQKSFHISSYFFQRSEIDFSHRSPSPICQRWFMVLYLKSEAKELALTVNIYLYKSIIKYSFLKISKGLSC